MNHIAFLKTSANDGDAIAIYEPLINREPHAVSKRSEPLTDFLADMMHCWMCLQYPKQGISDDHTHINRLHLGFLSKCCISALSHFERLMGCAVKAFIGGDCRVSLSTIRECTIPALVACVADFENARYRQGRLGLQQHFPGQHADEITHHILLVLAALNRPRQRI
jgi:hypothetical protein